MNEEKITLQGLYDLTRVLLNNFVTPEVWVSKEIINRVDETLDEALKKGARITIANQDDHTKKFMVCGYTFIEKPDIKGIVCLGNNDFKYNEKDTSIEDLLSLLPQSEYKYNPLGTPEGLKIFHDERQRGLTEDEICLSDGIVIKTHPKSRFGFEFFGFRSPEMVQEMKCFIWYAKGRKSMFDIGSLHGVFSLVFSEINPLTVTYAIEPEPSAFQLLSFNASVNKGNIHTHPFALSDKTGTVKMAKEWEHYAASPDGEFEVSCMTGDEFCDAHGLMPDTLKIDVEGGELKVLLGLAKTIEKLKPMIFLELHPNRMESQGDSVHVLLYFLKRWGYKLIDSRTNDEISYSEVEQIKTGEARLICIA